ncbi:MAG: GAF domain-containing protein [Chloroflexi bacterium]|nr:MAG: GAF domain-containing protein [Chloroflexota bacterium]
MSAPNDLYHIFFESADEAILLLENDRIVACNRRACAVLQTDRDSLVGQSLSTLGGQLSPEAMKSLVKKVAAGEQGQAVCEYVTPEGETIVCYVTLRPLHVNGKIWLQATLTPKADTDLQTILKLEHFRTLVEEALVGIYVVQEGVFRYVNNALATMVGYKPEEMIGLKTIMDVIAEEDRAMVAENVRKRIAGEEKTIQYTFRGKRKDGSIIYVEARGLQMILDGQPAVVGTLIDITERVITEQKLQASQAELQAKADTLAAINRIADDLYRTRNVEEVADRACSALRKFTGAPITAFYLLNKETQELTLVANRGIDRDKAEIDPVLPVEGTITGTAVTQGSIAICKNITKDKRVKPKLKKTLTQFGLTGSLICIPVLFQDETLGVINLLYTNTHIPSEEEQTTLLAIAKTIGIALANAQYVSQIEAEIQERAQIETRLQNRLRYERGLTTASRVLLSGLSNHDAINEALQYLLVSTGVCRVYLFENFEDPKDGLCARIIHEACAPGVPPQINNANLKHIPYSAGYSRWQQILAQGRPITGLLEEFPKKEQTILKAQKIQSVLILPIQVEGKWYGYIGFDNTREAHKWSDDDVRLLQTAADMIGIYLEHQKLEHNVRESLVRRERQVALSTQIAQEIASATSLPELYRRVVTQVKELFGYYHVQLLRYDPTLDTLSLVYGYGDVGKEMLNMHHSVPMGVGLIGTAAQNGRSVLRADVTKDKHWQPNRLLPHTKGELAVPIKLGNKVLGVLDVQSDKPDALTTDDQLMLEGLSGQIAIAIESTTLRQEMETNLNELHTLQSYLLSEGWQNFRKQNDITGFYFDTNDIQPIVPLNKTDSQANGSNQNGHQQIANPLEAIKSVQKPLVVRDTVLGILGVEEDPDNPLTPEEEEFLEAASEQIAQALEAARLLKETHEALSEQARLSSELETVARVSTQVSGIVENVEDLLQSVVDLTKESFNLYHVHIYLLNETGDALELAAGAGKIGQLMRLEGHYIPLHADSLVARAARTQKSVIVNDVRESVDFLPNPLLPDTRAEMAIPMIVGNTLIGVLDMQADKPDFFASESEDVYRTLASQVAVAIENARLYARQVQAAEKLREVDRLKSEFLASMSHELRTPLNSIIGFADVLLEGLDGELNERMEEDVRLIRESGRHLRELIGDILDMSKIEAGRMELRYEEVDVRQLANDIVATAHPLAQAKSLYMNLEITDDVNTVEADRTRLRQVMWNIVGNAIKFTEKGGVTITMEMQGDELLVGIHDTGIGIREEDIPIVFEQFRQIDGSLNRTAGGTGLGMPISKKLVELHGGKIWIESVVGQGSTFWFTIPKYRPRREKKGTSPLGV